MTVNSPLSLFSLVKKLMIEDIDPRLFSSKFLVNSLQIAILWELPKTLPNSFKVLIILLGLSKKIIVDGIDIKSLKKSTFCFVLTGGNPAKKNLSEDNPDWHRATRAEQAPGIDITLCPLLSTCLTNLNPGSEINGVPASQHKAIDLFRSNSRI